MKCLALLLPLLSPISAIDFNLDHVYTDAGARVDVAASLGGFALLDSLVASRLDEVVQTQAADYSLPGGRGTAVRSGGELVSGDTIARGGSLHAGDQLFAANKAANVKVQEDGNLVLYQGAGTTKVLWATNTAGKGGAGTRLVLQGDGNLVLYTGGHPGGRVLWATGSTSGARLVVQTDCNLVLYNLSLIHI